MELATARHMPRFLQVMTSSRGRVVLMLSAIVAVQTCVVGLVVHGSFFVSDDMLLFSDLQHGARLGLAYLFANNDNYLSPGYRLTHWVLSRQGVPSWDLALAGVLVFHAASTVLLQRILALFARDALWTFALALAFGVSTINVAVILNFGEASILAPATTFSLAAIHAHLVWNRTAKRAWLAWSVVAIGLGLSFYPKVVLVPVILALMWAFVLEPERPVAAGARAVARAWRVWALYAVPIAMYVIAYVAGGYAKQVGHAFGAGKVVEFLATAWLRAFGAGIFGLSVGPGALTAAETLGVVGAQLALAALVLWSVRRRSKAWRVWAFFGLAFLLNTLSVTQRLRVWGPELGASLRYVVETTYLFPIALAFAFAGAPATRGTPADGRKLLRVGSFVGLAAIIVVLSALGTSEARRTASGPKVRAWLQHLRADVRALRNSRQEPTILDGRPPESVIPAFQQLGRQASISVVTSIFEPGLRFDSANQPVLRVRDDGHLQPVRFVARVDESLQAADAAKRVLVTPRPLRRAGGWDCIGPEATGAAIEYNPPHGLKGPPWYLNVEVRAAGASMLGLWVDRGVGLPIRFDRLVATAPGRPGDRSLVSLGELPGGMPTFARLRFGVPPNSSACFGRLQVGFFLPRSGR